MEVIKEDYVSLETAKLLKEKGFLKGVDLRMTQNLSFYDNIGLTHNLNKYYDSLIQDKIDFVVAPTHQMVLKWLREKHKIAINIRIVCKKAISYVFDVWDFNIIHPNKFVGGTIDLREQQFDFPSYEEATEEAIKYCLNNLI
jgi:hypothetical protein